MRAIWNGFVSFGLVTIPVSVGLAQQRSDVSFRTLSRETGQPVKQKRWDPVNDTEKVECSYGLERRDDDVTPMTTA